MISLGKKLTKLPSIQGGPFNVGANTSTGVQRNIDLDIPAGMNINLSESFIQMRVNLNLPNGVLSNVNIVSTANPNLSLMNTDFIRNCWMDFEKGGRVEDIKRVNKLRRNLAHVLTTVDQKQNKPDALNSGLQDFETTQGYSPFLEIHKDDGFNSYYKDVYIRIKLNDLFELGNLQYLNTDKTGKIRVHLELEKKNYFQLTERTTLFVDNEEFMQDVVPLEENPASLQSFFTQVQYPNIKMVPWYAGQPVFLQYTYLDANANTQIIVQQEPHTIQSVSDPAEQQTNILGELLGPGIVKITLTEPLDNVSANGQFDLIIMEIRPTNPQESATWSVLTTELALCEYSQPQQSMDYDDLSYMTFTTEEFNNNYHNVSHIFELEPEAVNVLLMFDNGSPPQPISNYTDKFTYRLRTDDQDLVDYDTFVNTKIEVFNVVCHHALHYDMLSKTLLNMSKQLVSTVPSINMAVNLAAQENFTRLSQNRVLFLASPLPLTSTIKRFQVIIENQEEIIKQDIENIVLFKHCMKMVKL